MSTTKNFTIKEYNGTDYDTLYPQSTSQQILTNDAGISGTTVHDVLSTLNSRFTYKSNVSMNTIVSSGLYFCDGCSNAPGTYQYYVMTVIATATGASVKQIAEPAFSEGASYQRHLANSTWSAWTTMPTRAEVDALNDRFAYVSSSNNPDFNDFTKAGVYSLGASATNAPYTSDTSWALTVHRFGGDSYCKQIASRYNTYDEIFVRTCSSGTWSDWNVLKQRVLIPNNTTHKFILKPFCGYLVQIYGHLWFVQANNSTVTPPIITSLSGTGSTITCTAVTNQAAINVSNNSGYQWSCTITEIGL